MADRKDALIPLPAEKADAFSWASNAPAARVMSALEAARPGCARYVGGCVRDSLLGYAPQDIDIATTLLPNETMTALQNVGLGAAPTGIDHGTVTAVCDHVGIEVTTLRADVSTDGRRASVAFTQDWTVDATRRDFQLNAIYLTADGDLFDPVGGVAAALAGRVAFIGEADQRIREDYLRILRFFRFSARFAKGYDEVGLSACTSHKEGISTLSAERIGDELCKILALPNAPFAVEGMARAGVLPHVWSQQANLVKFNQVKSISPEASPPIGLAALFEDRDRDDDGKTLDTVLRLSKAMADRRKAALSNAKRLTIEMDEHAARAALYRIGTEYWEDAVVLAASADRDKRQWEKLLALPDAWSPPQFPIGGRDVLSLGVEKGPAVADLLKETEEQWIEEGFPDEVRARAILAEKAAQSGDQR